MFKVKFILLIFIFIKWDGSGKELELSIENKIVWKSIGEYIWSSGEGGFGRWWCYFGRFFLGI